MLLSAQNFAITAGEPCWTNTGHTAEDRPERAGMLGYIDWGDRGTGGDFELLASVKKSGVRWCRLCKEMGRLFGL